MARRGRGRHLGSLRSSMVAPVKVLKQGIVRLIQSRLVSAYLLSHNTINSTNRTLFTGSAEQPLNLFTFEILNID